MSGPGEIATLGIVVDASQVTPAANKLDTLTQAGVRAETQSDKLTSATKRKATAEAEWAAVTSKSTATQQAATAATQSGTTATQQAASWFQRASSAVSGYVKNLFSIAPAANSAAGATVSMVKSQEALSKQAGLSRQHMMNLGFQINDVATMLAMGANPFRVLASQGGQFVQIMQQSGTGPIGLLKAIPAMLGPVGMAIVGIGAAVAGGFAIATQQINKSAGDLTKGLGLTEEQLERVSSKTISMGDTVKATFQVAWDRIKDNFTGVITFFATAYQKIVDGAKWAVGSFVGLWVGAFQAVKEAWKSMPTFLGGEGKSFSFGDVWTSFKQGIKEGQKATNDFFADVTKQAEKNAISRILKEAGKAPKQAKSAAETALEQAEKQLAETRNLTIAQEQYNKSVAAGTMTVAQANEALQINTQLKSLEVERDKATGSMKEKLVTVYKQLTEALKAQNEAKLTANLLASNEANAQALAVAQAELSLVEATVEARGKELAAIRAKQSLVSKGYDEGTASPEQKAAADKYISSTIAIAETQDKVRVKTELANRALNAQLDALQSISDMAEKMANGMSSAFGNVGKAVSGLTSTFSKLLVTQERLRVEEKERIKNGTNDLKAQEKATKEASDANVEFYADSLGAAKQFFSEGSAGYRILQAAEMGYRAFQLAASIQAMATKATEAAAATAANATIASTGVTAGAASIFAALGPFGFPVVAAMLGVMASLGFSGSSGGGSLPEDTTAKDRQAAQGAGSVLGDANAKSESIANSLEILAKNTNRDLEYSNQMVSSLKSIEAGIGSLTGLLARQLSVGGLFDTSKLNLGTTGGGGGGLLGGLISGLFGSSKTTTELIDQGINIYATSIGNAVANGISAASYQTIKTTKESSGAFFGLFGGGTKTSTATQSSSLSGDFTGSIQSIIAGLRSTVLDGATKLGVEGAQAVIDAMTFSIGNISFKDMTGAEIKDALNSVFSKLGDEMVATAIPQVTALQQVGEGALETLSRLVKEYSAVDSAAKIVGFTFNAVGVQSLAARDRLIQAVGGLDAFTESVGSFVDDFLTEAQYLAPVAKSVAAEMDRLGLASISTKEQFVSVVQSIDASTAAGAELYGQLMAVAPAFAKVADAAKAVADSRLDLSIQILRESGNATAALTLERQRELSALDGSLVPLQKSLYAIQDLNASNEKLASTQEALNKLLQPEIDANTNLANAHNALVQAYNSEANALSATISKLTELKTSLLAYRASLDTASPVNNPARAFALAQAAFQDTAAAAAGGDQTAIGALPKASQDFLAARLATARTAQEYNAAVAQVKAATDAAAAVAQDQIDVATEQLNQLKASVAGLGVLNESVLGVKDGLLTVNGSVANATDGILSIGGKVATVGGEIVRVNDGILTVGGRILDLSGGVAGLTSQLDGGLSAVSGNVVSVKDAIANLASAQTFKDNATAKAIAEAQAANDQAIKDNAAAVTAAIEALKGIAGNYGGLTVAEIGTQTEVEKALAGAINSSIGNLQGAIGNTNAQLSSSLVSGLQNVADIMSAASNAQVSAINAATAAVLAAAQAIQNVAEKTASSNPSSGGSSAVDVNALQNDFATKASVVQSIADQGQALLSAYGFFDKVISTANYATGAMGQFSVFNSLWNGDNTSIADMFAELQRQYVDAFNVAYAAYKAIPGHATGLSYVPYDNYNANLHVGERVLTAQENREYGKQANDNYEALIAEMRGMRQDMNSLNGQVVQNTRDMAKVLRNVSQDGDTLKVESA